MDMEYGLNLMGVIFFPFGLERPSWGRKNACAYLVCVCVCVPSSFLCMRERKLLAMGFLAFLRTTRGGGHFQKWTLGSWGLLSSILWFHRFHRLTALMPSSSLALVPTTLFSLLVRGGKENWASFSPILLQHFSQDRSPQAPVSTTQTQHPSLADWRKL